MMPPDGSWIVLFALLGLVFGSFGTVLIARVPAGQHLGGRSRCPRCKHILGAGELIPVLSYVLQAGKCRHCHRPISSLYPSVEFLSALLFVLALFLIRFPLFSLLLALSLWLLLLIAVMDLRTRTIHDALNLSFIFFAMAYAVAIGHLEIGGPLLLVLFFGAQWLLSRGRWVGSGDILLGAGIGFLLGGFGLSLLCLGIAYVLGALAATVLLLMERATRKSHIPFGPFLAVSAVSVLVFGERLLDLLLRGFS
ncbi:MAG: prepilin peptidase [Candidatus Peregrinibacteria bacterium]